MSDSILKNSQLLTGETILENIKFHSVTLDDEKCIGCTNCLKRCPTEAIRVRNGKAIIDTDRCIDCGECIRVCPQRAKKAQYDKIEILDNYKWKIAIPPPALYSQFDNLDDIDYVLNGLIGIGFDSIFEVSRAAELISEYTRKFLGSVKSKRPVISSACPAIVRLISVRYPYLCENLLNYQPPVELAAKMARKEIMEAHPELGSEDIGVFFISPCPAKVSYARYPIGVEKSEIDAVLSISEIYFKLVSEMKKIDVPVPMAKSGIIGISWAGTGGEAAALLGDKYLAADGIENVVKILDGLENENISGLDFIELNACSGGCVGGSLNVVNPFIAKARIQRLRKYLPLSLNKIPDEITDDSEILWTTKLVPKPVMQLDNDIQEALKKVAAIEEIIKHLPGLDCASCGSPSCKAHAEDIIRGDAKESDCIFFMKEKIQELYKLF